MCLKKGHTLTKKMQIPTWQILILNICHGVFSNYIQVKDYSRYSILELEVYVKNYENTPEYADVVKNTNCEILNQEFHSKGDKLLLLCSDEYIEILKDILKNGFITGKRPALISPNKVLSDERIQKNDGQLLNFEINKYRGKESLKMFAGIFVKKMTPKGHFKIN